MLVTGERIYDLHVWTCRLQRTWHGAITYEKRKGWDTNQIPTQKDASSNTHHLAFNVYFTTGPPMFWVSKFWEAMIHGWRHQNQSHPASLSKRATAWMFTERFPKRSAYWERPTDHILRLMGIAQYDLQYSRNPCPSQVAMCCNVWNIHKKSIPRGPRDAKGLEEVSTCFIPRESVPFFQTVPFASSFSGTSPPSKTSWATSFWCLAATSWAGLGLMGPPEISVLGLHGIPLMLIYRACCIVTSSILLDVASSRYGSVTSWYNM